MRPDRTIEAEAGTTPVSAMLRDEAAARDRDGAFPEAAFAILRAQGLVADPPLGRGEIRQLLRRLAAVGRADLSTGRIYEGHVNALDLARRHGTLAQVDDVAGRARRGELFGIWNTDDPGDPLRLEEGRLLGRKTFASGVDGLSRAIVTVPTETGRQMILLPLAGLPVDRSWWRPLGMRASGSHVVDFTGLAVSPDWHLGAPGAYVAQPWFSAGAARFVAVQVGGMHAVFDAALDHLTATGRAGAPHQAHRIARMGIAVETGYNWLERAARDWIAAEDADAASPTAAHLVATVDAARSAVEAAALAVLEEAERGVGAAGFIAPHPLERLMRDLRTYLRQPNPDGALTSLGAAIAAGTWAPGEALLRESEA
ncbi:acyl-CoA dehydrogenase family protein [Antarcticirhabdus aurantiaca]|uniref:Acyl-CoA dehydrogenase family protein n=1 Tax=Antarcticirhabdus aurantiaca TaxID=2606717 RepID=A0ACD4NMM6_9HYPH|nr:acyl-CoA dehydrogenase family protein [Antarcticirhabdus aurantiaca]WAJ27998.1 acyl-CoA dehydrogenase family protein [Jeongeuplla avenae]